MSSSHGRWCEHGSGSTEAFWETGGVPLSKGLSITRVVSGGGVSDSAFLFSVVVERREEGWLVDTGGAELAVLQHSLHLAIGL